MQIVTGVVRSNKLRLTIYKVLDTSGDEDKNVFYGFASAKSDEEITTHVPRFEDRIGDYSPYTDAEFAARLQRLEKVGDYEILDHLLEVFTA